MSKAPEKPTRGEHIDVRMTAAQKAAIERAASKRGLKGSTWMKSLALEQTDWDPDKDPEWGRSKID